MEIWAAFPLLFLFSEKTVRHPLVVVRSSYRISCRRCPRSSTRNRSLSARSSTGPPWNQGRSYNLSNAYETTLTAVEPTADNTVSLPNQSGVLATEGDNLAFSIVFGG